MKTYPVRKMYMGIGKFMVPIPLAISNSGLKKGVSGAESKAQRLSEEERKIHHFVVRKMASVEEPIKEELVAEETGLSVDEVKKAIDKLESLKTFLYRSDGRGIDWAYPLSLDDTGHRMTVNTGESFYAAWAIDAFATPFVYGRLQNKNLKFTIDTNCANSGNKIRIDLDSDLNITFMTEGADPYYSMALINTDKMKEKSIVDVFWRRSVFFWSEEDVREYQRKTRKQLFYMNVTKISLEGIKKMQAAIFCFPGNGMREENV